MNVKAGRISIAWSQQCQKWRQSEHSGTHLKIEKSPPYLNIVLGINVVFLLWRFLVFFGRKCWFSPSVPLCACLTFGKLLCLPLCHSQGHGAQRAHLAGICSVLPFTRSQSKKGLYAIPQPILNMYFSLRGKEASFAWHDIFAPCHSCCLISWRVNFLGNSAFSFLLGYQTKVWK